MLSPFGLNESLTGADPTIVGVYTNIGFGNFPKAARWFYCSVWNAFDWPARAWLKTANFHNKFSLLLVGRWVWRIIGSSVHRFIGSSVRFIGSVHRFIGSVHRFIGSVHRFIGSVHRFIGPPLRLGAHSSTDRLHHPDSLTSGPGSAIVCGITDLPITVFPDWMAWCAHPRFPL